MTLEELKQLSIDYPEDWPGRVMPVELQDEYAFQVVSEYHAALDRLEYLLQSIPEPAPKPRPPHRCPEGECSCITYDSMCFAQYEQGPNGIEVGKPYFGSVVVKRETPVEYLPPLTERELKLAREAMGG